MPLNSANFPFDPLDPVNSPLDRLFLFWHAYDVEEELLEKWHNDAASTQQPTGNILYDFFLDTWGKGDWLTVRNDPPPRFDQTTYFQALGVVSNQLRREIEKKVLNEVLVPDGEKFKLPPTLKDGVTRKYADGLAQAEIANILTAFNACEIQSLKAVDKTAADEANTNCGGDNIYLHALVRMMEIETHCFEMQKKFLETGLKP